MKPPLPLIPDSAPAPKLPSTTRGKLEALANALLDDALTAGQGENPQMTTKDKVEIFKPVAIWYLGVQKAKKSDADDPGGDGTFEDLRKQINGNGVAKQ